MAPKYTGRTGLAHCPSCKCKRRFREALVRDSVSIGDFFIPLFLAAKAVSGPELLWLGKNCKHGYHCSALNGLKIDPPLPKAKSTTHVRNRPKRAR